MAITPEMARRELARRELAKRASSRKESSMPKENEDYDASKLSPEQNTMEGFLKSPGVQLPLKFAQGLGEAGQNIASFFTGGKAPRTNIGEAIGAQDQGMLGEAFRLGGKYAAPTALGGIVGKALKSGEKYIAPAILNNRNLIGQLATNIPWGALQYQPEEKNLGGLLPKGRMGAAIESGLGVGLGHALGKGIPLMTGQVKKLINYLHPEKDAQSFVNSLGKGTSTENIADLSATIQKARAAEEEEALIPKNKLMETEAKSKIVETPKKTKSKIIELPNGLSYAEEAQPNIGEYLSIKNATKGYDEGLKQLHKDFKKNPTFENSDALKIALGREKRRLQAKLNTGIYRESDKLKLDRIKRNEKALVKDQDNFSETLPEDKKDLYKTFKMLWAKNIPKYEKNKTINALSQGEHQGLTREKVQSAFKSPNKEIKGVIGSAGQDAVNKVLYNRLLNTDVSDVGKLADSLMKAKKSGGYENYISPEMEDFAKALQKRLKHRRILYGGALSVPAIYGTKKLIDKFE